MGLNKNSQDNLKYERNTQPITTMTKLFTRKYFIQLKTITAIQIVETSEHSKNLVSENNRTCDERNCSWESFFF